MSCSESYRHDSPIYTTWRRVGSGEFSYLQKNGCYLFAAMAVKLSTAYSTKMPESAATNGFGFENPIYDESNTENGATADDYLDVNSTEVLKPTGANSSRGDVAASASGAATLEAVNKRIVYLGVG